VDGPEPESALAETVTVEVSEDGLVDPGDAGCADTVTLVTTGGEFCGRKETVTSFTTGVRPPLPAIAIFHWM
jgi:hypothetical protein